MKKSILSAVVCTWCCFLLVGCQGGEDSSDMENSGTAEQQKTVRKHYDGPLIIVSKPQVDEKISNPLQIEGTARGFWYQEGTFTIKLIDVDGQAIATVKAEPQGDTNTEEFVPFKAMFILPTTLKGFGQIRFERDNAADLPEAERLLQVEVEF